MDDRERLRQLIRATLVEGGLKLPPGKRTDLDSALVKRACAAYVDFVTGWNRWLESRGKEPVELVGPSGSSAYAEVDAVEGKDVVYGDVDYLVSFPLTDKAEDFGDRRKAQAAVEREYMDLMSEYIRTARPHGVDVELTLKPNSVPSQVVLEMPNGELVQVDTVVTFPEHSEWMKGRYVPERGIKGYVTGNLFKVLGDYLTLTIGTEGVVARLKDGSRVTSKQRAGVKYHKVTSDFRNFLVDIARYVAGDDVEIAPMLKSHPGLDPKAVSVDDLARGIVGLANTLEAAGVADKREMLTTIMHDFRAALADTVERKVGREIAPEKAAKLRLLNDQQAERVARVFGV